MAAEGGSSAAHALQPDEPALEWWMAHRRDDPWFEKVAACEDAVNAAAREHNLVSFATRDLPRHLYLEAGQCSYSKWSSAVAAWEACYPHENVEMPWCEHCKCSLMHCACVSPLPCKVCAGQRWLMMCADVPLWFPGLCVCDCEFASKKN